MYLFIHTLECLLAMLNNLHPNWLASLNVLIRAVNIYPYLLTGTL